jgi:hypothetical protein
MVTIQLEVVTLVENNMLIPVSIIGHESITSQQERRAVGYDDHYTQQ